MIRPPPRPPLFPSTTLSRSPSTPRASAWRRSPANYSPCAIGPETRRHEPALAEPPRLRGRGDRRPRSEEHTSELQSQSNLVCRLLLEKKKNMYRLSAVVLPA